MPNQMGVPDRAMFYWGEISRTANAGGDVKAMWNNVREQATAMGWATPGVSATDISRLWSRAIQVRNAAAAFNAADPADQMDRRYLADAPWGRPLQDQNAAGKWLVRFAHETEDEDGIRSTEVRSVYIDGQLPPTVGELSNVIEQDAGELAEKYGVSHVGVQVLEILAV